VASQQDSIVKRYTSHTIVGPATARPLRVVTLLYIICTYETHAHSQTFGEDRDYTSVSNTNREVTPVEFTEMFGVTKLKLIGGKTV